MEVIKMKIIQKFLGIIAIAAIIGFGFTACGGDDGGGGGGGNITFNITNNHTVAIKSVSVQNGSANNYQPYIKDVSIAANGGTGSVVFNLEKNPIGYMISSFTVTFTDDDWVGSNSSGSYSSTTINVLITDAGSSGLSWDAE
jgi:hypothetical protein